MAQKHKSSNWGQNPDLLDLPSYRMKSLLEKIPGKITINTQEIFANSIHSKYYRPTEFLTSKIPKNCFSFFHLNIASLECHIDDLKSVLSILDFDFDVIGISESRIKNDVPIANLDIPGYKYEHTPLQVPLLEVPLFS